MKPLFKTTAVIWTEYDPSAVELSDLAREAENGSAYCSTLTAEPIADPDTDPDWDGTEFFSDGEN